MPSEPRAPVRGRQLEALRACLLYPQGLRWDARGRPPGVDPVGAHATFIRFSSFEIANSASIFVRPYWCRL
jgi:hypothetical protein